jgi:hypothetical protein
MKHLSAIIPRPDRRVIARKGRSSIHPELHQPFLFIKKKKEEKMNQNTRLNLDDSLIDSIIKLSEGNIGAARVCTDLFATKIIERTDPDSLFGAAGTLMNLDTLGIYGSRIWQLFKYVCTEQYENIVILFRAWQLGFIGEEEILAAVEASYSNASASNINFPDLLQKVQNELPNFGQNITKEEK